MKKNIIRITSAFLSFVIVFLMMPFGLMPSAATGREELESLNGTSLGLAFNMLESNLFAEESLSMKSIFKPNAKTSDEYNRI